MKTAKSARPPPRSSRFLALCRRLTAAAPASPQSCEISRGALCGALASVVLAAWAELFAVLPWAVPLGGLGGSLIGLLLWLGADNLAETPIPAPQCPPLDGKRRHDDS